MQCARKVPWRARERARRLGPERTCVGCRAKNTTGTLVRVALNQEGRLVIGRDAPGRGAWFCRLAGTELAQPGCLEQAAKRRAFSRALRREVPAQEVEALLARARERARMGWATSPPVLVPQVPVPGA